MGSVCGTDSPIDEDIMNDVQEAVEKTGAQLTTAYEGEQKRIVEKMKQASPKPYENLLFTDYPAKNKSGVNTLAGQNVTSTAAKKKMVDEIYDQIQPKLEAKTATNDPITRATMRKVLRAAIEKAVNASADALVKKISSTNPPPPPPPPPPAQDKPKPQ